MTRIAAAVIVLVLLAGAQDEGPRMHPERDATQAAPTEDQMMKDMERANQKKQNKARYDSLKADTDRLLQLATELKQSVDKSNENTLSIDVIKKAEQVEKLAHQVKEKMKG